MAGQFTREALRRMLFWTLVSPSDTTLPFTLPVELRLMSTSGTHSAAGTEITGDAYEAMEAYFAQSATTPEVEFVNTTEIEFNSLDSSSPVAVDGVELWDSSATPVRIALVDFTTPITIAAGYPYTIGIGQLKVQLHG